MSQKQVMPKSEDLSRSLEINAIWTFDTEFPTIFDKSCTYITFKSAVKHRQSVRGRGSTHSVPLPNGEPAVAVHCVALIGYHGAVQITHCKWRCGSLVTRCPLSCNCL